MTLLHLSAYLGYSRLVCALLHWKADNSSNILEIEVDALRQDRDGATPLMWAYTRGHRDTALLLYQVEDENLVSFFKFYLLIE